MWMGRAKMERWGPGAANSRRKVRANVHELAERRKARAQTGQLGGIVLALQSAALSEEALLVCDDEAVLCVIKKWVEQGGKKTLVTAPDADILLHLREIVCLLTQRVRAGRATFLIKVKSHRGEPINERADTLAEKGREIADDDKRWDDRTDRVTFEVRKGDTTVRSVWTNSATPSENKRGGLNCRRQEQQQQSTGQNACSIATTNAGCRRRGKERRHQRVEVSKMKGSGARNALKI